MKRLALAALLTIAATGLSAQTNNIVRGIVTFQNSNSQPAANVQITTFGANPVYTNSAGQFEIRFSGGKPGQTVRLIVQKESFLILGPDPMVFETGIRENPDDFVRIALANVQEFQNRMERFMGSIDRRIQEQSQAIQSFQSDQSDKIAQLYKELEELEKSKEELARQFAAIDLDQASSFAKEALQKFESGDLSSAMELMNKETLDAHYQKVLAQEEKLEKAKAQAIENYILLARMQRADLKFEEAAQTYRDAIEKDPSNVANLMELGRFLSEMNLDNEALSYLSSALALSRDETQKIDLLNVAGGVLTAQNRPAQADSLLQEALALSKESADPADALKVLASLGALYQTTNDFERAEQYFLEGLGRCETLFQETT
jgi:tetratricopeptide (TPR) repeat protein